MTKDEYEDFALRYKGCGACFPMYHTLSRFEKMWFSAIQKDVAKLEKENAELRNIAEFQQSSDMNRYFENKKYVGQLTKAKELIEELSSSLSVVGECGEEECELLNRAEQFLKENIE